QVLDFVGCGAFGRLQQARLDPQHLGDGPAFAGLVRNGKSFFNDIQRGVAAAQLSVSLGFEREKDWQPQARARLAPGRETCIKFFNPLVYLPLAGDGPAVENPPARRPERKVVLGADRNDGVSIRSHILRTAAEDIHHAAGMTNGVGKRKRMWRRLSTLLPLARDRC